MNKELWLKLADSSFLTNFCCHLTAKENLSKNIQGTGAEFLDR